MSSFPCAFCWQVFDDVDLIVAHMRDTCPSAPQGQTTRWSCGSCPSILGDRSRFREHLLRVHRPSTSRWSIREEEVLHSPNEWNGSPPRSPSPEVADTTQQPFVSPHLPVQLPVKTNPAIVAELTRELAAIAADSLKDTAMTEKTVQFFMDRFMHYQQTVHAVGLENLYRRLSAPGSGVSNCCLRILNAFLNEHKNLLEAAFKPMRSTYTRMAYFVQEGSYICHEPILASATLSNAVDHVRLTDRDIHVGFGTKDQFVHVVPMRRVLAKLFSIPGFLTEVLEWEEKCARSPLVTCFQESEAWLSAARETAATRPSDSYLFAVNVFYDDFESGNALGSHSAVHKLGGVYYSLPFVPPRLASKLNFIMLAAVFKSRVREVEGNQAVFGPIIEELKYLYEHGINVEADGRSVNIRFMLGCLIGDNLGLNSMLGFTSSFNSNRCCRVCRISKHDYNTTLSENPELLRTNENFLEDLEKNDPRETGVAEPCVWLQLPYFKLNRNCSVDVMHDMFEGCAKYVMLVVLEGLIYHNSAFTLAVLNDRIKNINYGPDSGSKPMSIGASGARGFNMRMSASEMRTFVAYFGLMVGHYVDVIDYDPDTYGTTDRVPPRIDAVVDDQAVASSSRSEPSRSGKRSQPATGGRTAKRQKGNKYKDCEGDAADFYKLYLLLSQVIRAISQDSVDSRHQSREMAGTIEFFLSRFIRLSNLLVEQKGGGVAIPAPMQPKFHFLTHYPSMMKKHGPLSALSSFRFESKNKQMKTGLKNSFNHINTPHSAAKKEQYHLNHLFFHNTLPSKLDQPGKCTPITDPEELYEINQVHGVSSATLFSIKYVHTYDGIKFAPDYVVAFDADNEMGLPVFSKIIALYFDKATNETYYSGQDYHTVAFCPHYRAYFVYPLETTCFNKLSDRLHSFPNTLVRALDYNYYVVMRNSL